MRRRLRVDPGEGIGRVAILGPEGIADAALRTVFQTPGPQFKVPDLKMPRLPDHNDRRYDANADVHTAAQLNKFGPGGSGWGL